MTYRLEQDVDGGPVLVTGRLRLRKPVMADAATSYPFWSGPRSQMMGGPWTREYLTDRTQDLLDQWQKHGFSLFTVTKHGSDEGIGGIGPYFPDTHAEPELGWSLWNAADEGQGLAHEAAAAARDWFFATTGYKTAVSFTDPANHRSHRLCERLGGVVDMDTPVQDPGDRVYRYHIGGAA